MGQEVTLGGERLGAGKRQKVYLDNYQRSTHDKGYVWRSTMSAGTLVPFMSEVGLPGDTFDIDLNVDILTHPTIGPLFGTYKIQLDVFQIPVRLYQAKLHMNMLGIGMDMSKVALPQVKVYAPPLNLSKPLDNQQLNPSCLMRYLGVAGVGYGTPESSTGMMAREFSAIPLLAYWDIYKNYYANKQEEVGVFVTKDVNPAPVTLAGVYVKQCTPELSIPLSGTTYSAYTTFDDDSYIIITGTNVDETFNPELLILDIKVTQYIGGPGGGFETPLQIKASELFKTWTVIEGQAIGTNNNKQFKIVSFAKATYNNSHAANNINSQIELSQFPLKNIDTIRQNILQHASDAPYMISSSTIPPYGPQFARNTTTKLTSSCFAQVGLGIKTYQSDLFNNWISTEWIDGPDGISEITAIDTSGGSFTIDELNLSRKVYDMLNRIALSGGTYDDWLDAVYTHERTRGAENPMYIGGLQTRLTFQEVVSNAETPDKPLGTLAGRGRVTGERKGGHVVAKIDEPSYIMGIISLTPYIDYSQGNSWDMNLKTMNDFHKPALDQIGFQDLITDQMAFWDTEVNSDTGALTTKSAGKQPAWINYMTNVNRVYGNFADANQQMFMVLNRRYSPTSAGGKPTIADLTTYIDPSKFNNIFADTSLDAQNFWAQVGVNITARRKMSAKVIPNL